MKLDPDTPAPREATEEERAVRLPGGSAWSRVCETVRELPRFEDVALATVGLALDPTVGAQSSAWCQVDRESDQLRGVEASMPQDRDLVQSMPASESSDAGLLALLAQPRKARRAAGAEASLIRRVRFSLLDRTLGPVAALGSSQAGVRASQPGLRASQTSVQAPQPAVRAAQASVQAPQPAVRAPQASAQAPQPLARASQPTNGQRNGPEIEHPLELARILGEGSWTYWTIAHDGVVEAVLCLRDLPDSRESREALDQLRAAAGAASSRIRLASRLKAHERRARALAELPQRVLSASTLEDLLDEVVRTAARTLEAPWATIWTLTGAQHTLRPAAHCGQTQTDERETRARLDQAARCADDFRPRPLLDSRGQTIGSLIALHAFETPLGAFAIAHGGADASGEEMSRDRSFLEVLGALTSLALRNVDLGAELRAASRRERELQGMLQQNERLATIGETSAHLARQLELPLNAIGETAKALANQVADDDPRVPQADLIAREARRLLALVREQVALMQLDRPRLRNVDLSELARDAFSMVKARLERAGVRIEEEHEPNLPPLLLDHAKVTQVLLRVIEHISEPLERGARFSLRTRRDGPVVAVEIASEAEPPEGGVVDSLFLPFGGGQGAGLGLAVARQIILDHGGELEACSDETWPLRFRIRFPIRENQDRRGRSDRRTGRDRRRAA